MNEGRHRPAGRFIYTIGHSNHSEAGFFQLLSSKDIQVLVDVRSHPVSQHFPHFHKKRLEEFCKQAGIEYIFLGKELGGRRAAIFYDDNGRLDRKKVLESALFRRGLLKLIEILRQKRTAFMCAEENPLKCHRHYLLTPALTSKGIKVWHIRSDGKLNPSDSVPADAPESGKTDKENEAAKHDQLSLF